MGDIYHVHGWETYVRYQLSTRLSYSFSTIPDKIPARLLTENDKLILKIIWKHKGSRVDKITEKNKIEGLTLLEFNTCKAYKAIIIIIKTISGCRNRSVEQSRVQK